ncbi:3-hydroxyphenylacetate 6-hydroxylase [Paramyrothecium foliicola]|nr:3-hydroxyphenylacetate 6-hydroxylase [Paramyrothecium foliicola]
MMGLVGIVALSHVIANEIQRCLARIKGLNGPRGWPIVGNILDIRQMAAQNGQQCRLCQENLAVQLAVSSLKARNIYISQGISHPSIINVANAFQTVASGSAGLTIGTSRFNESLKRRKKGAAVALNRRAIQSYTPFLDIESRDFVRDLWVDNP